MCTAGFAGYTFHKRQLVAAQAMPQGPGGMQFGGGLAAADNLRNDELQGTYRPDFSLPDISGKLRHISEWDGRVIVLNFWASWCKPCLVEIPGFVKLQTRYGARGLQFIGIALERPEDISGFVREQGMNYPVLTGETEVIEIATEYGNTIGALPYTVIIDRAGIINFIKHGELAFKTAEDALIKLL
jgi:peroxiredoxin